eukprot:XP_001708447.1 Hypothetical protein GL50803_29051 [Giardia lamblia ATCC 50803]
MTRTSTAVSVTRLAKPKKQVQKITKLAIKKIAPTAHGSRELSESVAAVPNGTGHPKAQGSGRFLL